MNECSREPERIKNMTFARCEDLPQQVTRKLMVGRNDHVVVIDFDGQIIELNKEGALQLGQLIIDNALKL